MVHFWAAGEDEEESLIGFREDHEDVWRNENDDDNDQILECYDYYDDKEE